MPETTARAVTYSVHGDASVLTLTDRSVSEPGPGQVRVRNIRSGVNPADWKLRAMGAGRPVEPAQVPNKDGSGVVDAVGEGVERVRVGDRVWVYEAAHDSPEGTAQEFSILPDRKARLLPDHASFDLGASLGIPFLTAHRALTVGEGPHRLGEGTHSGRIVLVSGGAGAVGNAAIQLAVWAGATVLATVSGPGKAKLAAAAGAHHVIDYRTEDAVAAIRSLAPDGVDTIVEVAPGTNADLDRDVIARFGTVACYVSEPGGLKLSPSPNLTLNVSWQFLSVHTVPCAAHEAALEDVQMALEAGALGAGTEFGLPLHHFPLADTAAAHEAVRNHAVGKVLIDVDG